MKFNINWKELGKQLWQAVWPVILGALGGGIVAVTGCSSMQPSDKTQSISGANFTQDFLKRLPEAWCKSSLKLNVGALADVDEKTLAKHDIKRDVKGVWSPVERAA